MSVASSVAVSTVDPGTERPRALECLVLERRGRCFTAMLGPAFVAAVAYVDPGNFATDFAGGTYFGYVLVWVVLAASLMAMLIQYLAAKVGVVTGQTLLEICRARYRTPVAVGLWIQAEIVAMSTDVAEFVGAAIGLQLLFRIPPAPAGVLTAVVAFAVLHLQRRGFRSFELATAGFVGVICLGFVYETLRIGPSVRASLHGLVPTFSGSQSLMIAAGIVGATVMPHVIYLHSDLTRQRVSCRDDREKSWVMRYTRIDILVALGVAAAVNIVMLLGAAKLFHHSHTEASITLLQVQRGIGREVGGAAALVFAVALLASGISSSSVGTHAGQVIMNGFTSIKLPLFVRRAMTMTPALLILCLDAEPTKALVMSQVVLSLGIPFALVPLVLVTRDRRMMGVHANQGVLTWASFVIAATIVLLNVVLLAHTFGL